ncbi:hypothetical protein ACFX14_007714 [Malus domestica]
MSLGLFLPLLHHWRRLLSSSSLPLSIHPPTECSFFISSDGDICSSTKTKTTEISPKCSSKSASHSLLHPLGNATEKKPSSSTFQQVKKKNPLCPAMVPKPVDNARTVSNKATAVTPPNTTTSTTPQAVTPFTKTFSDPRNRTCSHRRLPKGSDNRNSPSLPSESPTKDLCLTEKLISKSFYGCCCSIFGAHSKDMLLLQRSKTCRCFKERRHVAVSKIEDVLLLQVPRHVAASKIEDTLL